MPIHYYLKPSQFDAENYFARIRQQGVCGLDAITSDMLERGSTITEADIKAVLTVFFDVVTDRVADGHHVNLPIANIRPGISGTFSGSEDAFDPERHQFKATLTPGIGFLQKMRNNTFNKIASPKALPTILQCTDLLTQSANRRLSPGNIAQLDGDKLKFNPADTEEGVFLIATNGIVKRVEVFAQVMAKKVIFQVPANIDTGHYQLEVRKRFGSAASLIRTGQLQHRLEVV